MSSNGGASSVTRGRGLGSLYEDLLEPTLSSASAPTQASITRAPVIFDRPSAEESQEVTSARKQSFNTASLRFQPSKRPQMSLQKTKLKSKTSKLSSSTSAVVTSVNPVGLSVSDSRNSPEPKAAPKTTLADWTATDDGDDVNGFFAGEKRQRGGRKRRKKNREDQHISQNWDDIYDLSRPNSYEEYEHSGEKIKEVKEWKDRLYAHRIAVKRESTVSSGDDERRHSQFAPPSNYSFAPPSLSIENQQHRLVEIPNDSTGEDAYTRRLLMSQAQPVNLNPNSSPSIPLNPLNPMTSTTGSISRAAVRYNLPLAPEELPRTEAELHARMEKDFGNEGNEISNSGENTPTSRRPGQSGFAERLMSKYGWTKGTGLGASGTGIVNPLRVQVEKQKKKPDSEGGGFVGPGGRGKIIASRKGNNAQSTEEGKFGRMSEVVILKGMVDGMDLDAEMRGEEGVNGGLMQEIGEECGEKYGRVERVYIYRHDVDAAATVFVKFTSQLSALRAVNALEGRIFNGNSITARFYDVEKFEQGVYNFI